jgi:hypothetical protein
MENVDGEFLNFDTVAFMLAPNESNTTGVAHDRGRLYAREIIRPLAFTSGFDLWLWPLAVQRMLDARGAGAELASR